MLRQEQIAAVIDSQKITFLNKGGQLLRAALAEVPVADNFVTIITGLRRCGKSTLLLQFMQKNYSDALYLNFEDIRLTAFSSNDFLRLKDEITQREIRVLFFDEIQLVDRWEIFIHQLLNEGYTVFVTGSNASLLSREMGTHLTGRHLSMELFPFSYEEFLQYKGIQADERSLSEYLRLGGVPDYVKNNMQQILISLVEDILIRDIAVRYGIRDVAALNQLLMYLMSNVGTPVSANKLTGMFGIKSSTTILDFFNYYADSYLLDFVPQFSYSLKVQARNPKKIYAMDTGFVDAISIASTQNLGRKLENLIFLHLRRKYKDIRYFKDKGECDFIAMERGRPKQVIQTCYEITDENFDREINGLMEAMKTLGISEGWIVTMHQADRFAMGDQTITMIPAHEFMMMK